MPNIFNLSRSATESDYAELNDIDLRQFYLNTTSRYFMFHCHLQTIDCRVHWEVVHTSFGSCLTLKPQDVYEKEKSIEREKTLRTHAKQGSNKTVLHMLSTLDRIPSASKFKELDFTIGFNKSDGTFGWNGFNNALVLYYMDIDETYASNRHSVALVPGLNPSVIFSRSETRLLGKPFTDCNNTVNYTQRSCQVENYMRKLISKCNCYPRPA